MRRHIAATVVLWLLAPLPAMATQVQEVTSKSGITAWLVEEHAVPLVVMKVAFGNAGAAYDPKGKEGLASMTSDMLMEGAGTLDSRAFNEAVDGIAARMGFGVGEDYMYGEVTTLSEYTTQAFGYFAQALAQPRFDADAIERVRAQMMAGLKQQEKKPGYLLGRAWQKAVFGSHPYGRPGQGTQQSLAAIRKEDVVHFAQHSFARDNVTISVVGDITPEALARQLDTVFAALPLHASPEAAISDVRLPAKAAQEVVDLDIPQTLVRFGGNGLKREEPDYYAAYMMNEILGGGGALTSKLGIEVREKRGLAYSIYSALEPMKHAAVWGGEFSTRNDQVGAALGVWKQVLKDFVANGPTAKELSDAKKHVTGSFVLELDSNSEIASFLTSMQIYHLGRDYFDRRNAIMEAVTAEQVKGVAAKLANPDTLQVVMVGKPKLQP